MREKLGIVGFSWKATVASTPTISHYKAILERDDAILRIVGKNGVVLLQVPLNKVPHLFGQQPPEVWFTMRPMLLVDAVSRWDVPDFVDAVILKLHTGVVRWLVPPAIGNLPSRR